MHFLLEIHKNMISAMNRLGTCARYKSVRGLLASYAIKASSDDETPLPTTFTEDDWIMSGMDNAYYNDISSCLERKANTMMFFSRIVQRILLSKNHMFLALDLVKANHYWSPNYSVKKLHL